MIKSKEANNDPSHTISLAFAIVVYREAYFTTAAFRSLITSLAQSRYREAVKIFVYDNTDLPEWRIPVGETEEIFPVEYFHNPHNPGISVAYNYMAACASNTGFDWIVFLDQDTNLPANAVEKYIAAIKELPQVLIKAPLLMVGQQIFSPSAFFLKRSIKLNEIQPGIYSLKKYTPVNSGLLVNLPLFFEVQGYDEKLKLDFTDFVFLDKVRAVTSQFELLDMTCQHEFSNNETDLGKSLSRYVIFKKDLSNCPRKSMTDRLGYFLVGSLHLLKLSMKFRSLRFLKIHFS